MIIYIDTETTGVNLFTGDKIFGISWALGDTEPRYIDVRNQDIAPFKRDLNKADLVVAHNVKFDAHALYQIGIDLIHYNLDCTMVRAQLLDEHKFNYDLDSLTGEKLDIIDDLADMFGGKATKNVQMKNLHKVSPEFVARYAKQDIVALRKLYKEQEEQEFPPVYELERKVIKVLIQMERRGIRVDTGKIDETIYSVKKMIDAKQKELDSIAGKHLNVNSTPQMRGFLVKKRLKSGKFELVDGTIAGATKADAASLDADTLKQMTYPPAKLILDIRRYKKILDTFLVSQIQGHLVNGRVHPNFNQTRVVTGRLSCNSPNLQAIPKRDPEMKKLLRSLFIPEEGAKLLRCDYEQSDVRGFAHYISLRDPDHPIKKAYQKDPYTDFHTLVAEMMDIPRDPNPETGNAKQLNLAQIFGMGAGKLAQTMGLNYTINEEGFLVPGEEAQRLFDLYHETIPGVGNMSKKAAHRARLRGYVISILGRYLRFPDKRFCHKAAGYLYQAWTADIIKAAMVSTYKVQPLHLSVHDELIFSVYDMELISVIKHKMESVLDGISDIPIRTVPEIGDNWASTKPITEGY